MFLVQYAKPPSCSLPQLKHFEIIPSTFFLCAQKHSPAETADGLKLSTEDANLFKDLKSRISVIRSAVKELGTKKKKSVTEDNGEDEV